jgi:hypothetical protein
MLYNIFSSFGNVKKIIFIKEKFSALVEYQKVESAVQAKEMMNDIMF